jgi:hypothetical protein
MKHWCGCITLKKGKNIYCKFICDIHKLNKSGLCYIVLQHCK